MDDQYTAILLAAGTSRRFQHPMQLNKLLMPLNERPVFDYSLRLFNDDPRCKKIIFVVNPENQAEIRTRLTELYKEEPVKIEWMLGGRQRQDSVSHALQQVLCSEENRVLIHDAARPFVTQELIDRLIDQSINAAAATLAVPAKDTIKRVKDSVVYVSLYRPEVWQIQTPQVFDCRILKQAMKKAEADTFYGNEETELVERLGYPVRVVAGADYNFKLTTAFDYRVARVLSETEQD